MTGIIVVGLVAVALQLFLTYRQMLHFSSEEEGQGGRWA